MILLCNAADVLNDSIEVGGLRRATDAVAGMIDVAPNQMDGDNVTAMETDKLVDDDIGNPQVNNDSTAHCCVLFCLIPSFIPLTRSPPHHSCRVVDYH